MTKNKTDAPIEPIETPEEIAALKAALAEARQQLDDQALTRQGWLITTPNAGYSGKYFNNEVVFSEGMAFIVENQVYSYFVSPLEPKKQLNLMYTEEEQLEILENRKRLTSQRAVDFLTKDYGYSAEYFSKDQSAELDQRILEQKARAAVAIEQMNAMQKALTQAFADRAQHMRLTTR